jgi:ATP-dependent helicase/nuclease subunit B
VGAGSRDGGLRVIFDPAIDGGAWPGSLRGRDAAFGEAWLGPLGLIARLETELGLGGSHATAMERVAAFTHELARNEGFWSRSFELDPLATSGRMLADRDTLALWGWRGEAASPRLVALWRATSDALPGLPERLERILDVIQRRDLDLQSVRVADPVELLPPLWRRVFDAMSELGVRIELAPLLEAASTGDLAGARHRGFAPVADGSLTLLRLHGPLAAADEVAAALAALDSLDDVLLVGPDLVLDEALGRHGLPRIGAAVAAPGSVALVRLVVETAFAPMNPADLHGLLCAEPGPVPRGIARQLAGALASTPGRGSPGWREALARGISVVDESRQSSVGDRLAALLEPVAERGGEIGFDQLENRLRALTGWARGRLETDATLVDVIGVAERLLHLIARMGRLRIGRLELRRLCDEVDRTAATRALAEVGLAAIPKPGAMLGPAGVVVWWGFTRDRAASPPRLRLSEAERAALRASGVVAPDAGAMMASEARRWRRPLMLTSGAVVLVCPQTNEAGELAHPHPLWDELTSSMIDTRLAHRLEARVLKRPAAARRQVVELRPVRAASDAARATRSIALREVESPSSIERLLGCSLAWALHYRGGLRRGLSRGPADPSPLLFGTIAHHLLAGLFAGGALPADEAAALAEKRLEAELPLLSEALCLPDHQVERAALKRAVVQSAREIAALLERTGASIRGTEVILRRVLDTFTMEGRADLVLASPDLVIDLKWGITASRERLASDAALQLAAYAELCREGARLPQVAFFIINSQKILAEPGTCLTDAQCPGSASAAEMWRATSVAIEQRRDELAGGHLVAPGALEDGVDSALVEGTMHIAPGCRYCDLDAICGRRGVA